MRKIVAFEQVSLDGFFVDVKGGMSWAHKHDAEWNAFTADNAGGNGALLFGRKTYEMMASFWPSPVAMQATPKVAEGMNNLSKFVFSRTLQAASWKNTTLMKGDLVTTVREMKKEEGADLVILGSGSIVSQLAEARLIDEFQIVVNPLINWIWAGFGILALGTGIALLPESSFAFAMSKVPGGAAGSTIEQSANTSGPVSCPIEETAWIGVRNQRRF